MDNYNKLTVVKHNALAEAGYRFSIYESRIILTCISKINSMGAIDNNETFTVTVGDLAGLNRLDKNSAYRNLEKAVNRLFERSVTIELPNNEVLKMRWVSSIKYIKNAGTVELQFSQKIIPYISQLRRDFTQYRLQNVLLFKSNYSIRIYELLIKWGGNEKVIEVDWLKKHFRIEGKYKNIGDLKKKVIEPAMNEINEHSDMVVSYEQVKRGRRIVGFRFTYGLKRKPTKKSVHGINDRINGVSKATIEKQARAGETYEQAAARINKQVDADTF